MQIFLCKRCNVVVYCDSCVSEGIEQNILTVALHRRHAFSALAENHKPQPQSYHKYIPCKSQKQQVKMCYTNLSAYCTAPGRHWICCIKCYSFFGTLFFHLFVLVQSIVCVLLLFVPEASSSDRCCSEGDSCCSTELRPFAHVVDQAAGCVASLPVRCSLEFCSKF